METSPYIYINSPVANMTSWDEASRVHPSAKSFPGLAEEPDTRTTPHR